MLFDKIIQGDKNNNSRLTNWKLRQMKFVSKGPFNNKPSLFQIMPWHETVDKLSSELMMTSMTITYIELGVTRDWWVNEMMESLI